MSLNSIEHEWNRFASLIYANTNPSLIQQQETKQAFFAGAWALFTALEEIGEPHISEEQGEEYLTAREAEMIEFKNELMKRYSLTN